MSDNWLHVSLLKEIAESWAWMGVDPARVVRVSKFGNVVFEDRAGKCWRICPEELECKCIAESLSAFQRLSADAAFHADWEMARLVAQAESKYGVLPEGRCFCLKIPGVLGGEYGGRNIGTISIVELMRFSGDVAKQIKDLPPGSKVQFKVMD